MVSTAFSAPPWIFHSFSRKFKSNEVIAPAALASFIISAASGAVVGDRAANIPPQCTHLTPLAKIAFQSKSPGFSSPAASLQRL